MADDNPTRPEIRDLNRAIDSDDLETVNRLLASNHRLVCETTILGSCLHLAAALGRLRIVQRFVEAGADVNLVADVGAAPIDRASANGHVDVVKYLLTKGANLDVSKPNRNPLFSAIYDGHVDVARFLLTAGIDPHVAYKNQSGKLRNALTFAQEYGQTEIADLLIKSGCRLPIEGVDKSVWQPEKIYESTAADEAHERIVSRLAEIYGPVDTLALQEIVPVHEDVHVAIHVIRPNVKHPYMTLFTIGMSDRPMNVPKGQEDYQYAESLMHLPADWPHPRDQGAAEDTFWPFAWLRQVAYYPHLHDTWLGGPMTIISSDDPPVPLGPNTKQTCLLLLADFSDWSPIVLDDGKKIRFYTVVPIYTEERDFEVKHGMVPLLQRLEQHGFTTVTNINRDNVASKG